jgi:hypothetical protein
MHDNEEHRVREVIDALVQLIERDVELLRLNVHERTITARLAELSKCLSQSGRSTPNTIAFDIA